MRLTIEQGYTLLERYGCHVTEACDKCGQLLGPVRYNTPRIARFSSFASNLGKRETCLFLRGRT